MRMPKVLTNGFSMDRKKDGKGNLSVDTRRVTTEEAPSPDFFETRKNKAGLLACASQNRRMAVRVDAHPLP